MDKTTEEMKELVCILYSVAPCKQGHVSNHKSQICVVYCARLIDMLFYRKMDTSKDIVQIPSIPSLPKDLIEYVREAEEAYDYKLNGLQMRILDPKCFIVESGKLLLRPFCQQLLSKCIKHLNVGTNDESKQEQTLKMSQQIEMLKNKLDLNDLKKIARQCLDDNSILITLDLRDDPRELKSLVNKCHILDKKNSDNLKIHFIDFAGLILTDICIEKIAKLLEKNIACYIKPCWMPFKCKNDTKNDSDIDSLEDDVEYYLYDSLPNRIRDLPFEPQHLSSIQTCFVWDGKVINGQKFNLKKSQESDKLNN